MSKSDTGHKSANGLTRSRDINDLNNEKSTYTFPLEPQTSQEETVFQKAELLKPVKVSTIIHFGTIHNSIKKVKVSNAGFINL